MSRLSHVFSAEHRLGVVAVHYVANPDLFAGIVKRLHARVDFAVVEPPKDVLPSLS
jgi:hypothetical protein